MRRSVLNSVLKSLCIALLSVPSMVHGEELFSGDLGRWLSSEAYPRFSELVGKHPRFNGELIQVISMSGGQPAAQSDALTQAIRKQLTQQLTRLRSVQIAWREPERACGIRRTAPYLLGVEVARESRGRYSVTLALVDVEEGVWVNGGYQQWRGSLTLDERTALGRVVSEGAPGSIDAPIAAQNRSVIVAQLLERIDCALRGGLDGSVRVVAAQPEDELLQNLVVDLRGRYATSASVHLAEDPAAADWELSLALSESAALSVSASLVPVAGAASQAGAQRLATVFVSRKSATSGATVARVPRPVATDSTSAASPASRGGDADRESLIVDLHEVPSRPGEPCHRLSAACVEVTFDLAFPSYVIVLRTQPGQSMKLGSCGSPRRTSGSKRYRLSVRDPGAGFYALATRDADLASRLQRTLAAGAENCGARSRTDWLGGLEKTLARAGEALDWRVFRVPPRYSDQRRQVDSVALSERTTASPNHGTPTYGDAP